VTRTLRPPRGRGTTILRTQAARLGERRGVEAAIMWQVVPFSPLGLGAIVYNNADGSEGLVLIGGDNPVAQGRAFGVWHDRHDRGGLRAAAHESASPG
jgi:hypothetical protein